MAQKSFAGETHNAQQQLNSFDFAQIDEMDPSLADGHRLIYDKEINFHIRFFRDDNETQDLQNKEPLRTRIFVLGDERSPQLLKIELHSDNDLFFHFTHMANENNFKAIKQQQQLNIDYNEYSAICVKCFNKVDKDQQTQQAVAATAAKGCLIHEQLLIKPFNFELDTQQYLRSWMKCSNDEFIRQVITYKYMSLKSKLSLMEGRLQDIHEIVRVKNPSLLLSIKKSVNEASKSTQGKSSLMRK